MADGGLLLNFAAGDKPTLAGAPKFKGGSWRKRMRLNKGPRSRTADKRSEDELRGGDSAYLTATRSENSRGRGDADQYRPAKRIKVNDAVPSTHERVPNKSHLQRDKSSNQTQRGDREVISSLFTYNPKPQTVEEELKDQDEVYETKPSNAPLPDGIDTFTSLGLGQTLAAHLLTKMSLKNPTAIQKAAIAQIITENADVFIQSETGSGKTLAYLLPIVQRLMTMAERQKSEAGQDEALHRYSGLFAIILAPTRELCKQISVVLEKLLGCANYIVAGTVIGGEKKKSEKARLRKGLNILVATPGRLVDHLENTQSLDVSSVRYLVLDEGDRLMDLGFEEDINKIVRGLDGKRRKSNRPGLPEKRMAILCSATLRANVEKLGDISLKDAVLVKGDQEEEEGEGPGRREDNVKSNTESAFLAPAQLKQSYIVAAAKLRFVTLAALLKRTFSRKGSVMKAIVFVSCADSVDFHFQAFTRSVGTGPDSHNDEASINGQQKSTTQISDTIAHSTILSSSNNALTCYKLHGSLAQQTRTSIVKAFSTATTPSLLIATDVASRGLDLPNLDLVIEYDPAFSKEDHLHRIGRTARLGRDGRAVILLLPGSEEGYVKILKESYKKDAGGSNVTSTSSDEILKKGFTPASGLVSSEQNWEAKATNFQLDLERWVLSDAKNKEMAKSAFQSHIRAYATHVATERQFFDMKGLHLGHLAKSFGLRDPPGKVNMLGMGRKGGNSAPKANEGRKRKDTAAAIGDSASKADIDATVDADEAASRMRQMVRNRKKMMGVGADEFNIA